MRRRARRRPPEGGKAGTIRLPRIVGNTSVFPEIAHISGRRRGDRRLRMVFSVDRKSGRSLGAGTPQEAARDRREHSQNRQDRRRGAGHLSGIGHDSPGLSADAANPSASGSGTASVLAATSHHFVEVQGPQRLGALQRGHRRIVHAKGRATLGGRAAFAGRSLYGASLARPIGVVSASTWRGRSTACTICRDRASSGMRSAGPAGHDSSNRSSNDRRSTQRIGRLATISLAESRVGFRGTRPRLPQKRWQMPGTPHQQGRLAPVALGHDPGGLATGGAFVTLAFHAGPAPNQYGLEEEGDCRRGASSAVHDVCDASVRQSLRTARRAQRQPADNQGSAAGDLGTGSTEGGHPFASLPRPVSLCDRVTTEAMAEGARGNPSFEKMKETIIQCDQAWDPTATPSLTLEAVLTTDHVRVNGGAVLYSFFMATAAGR